MIEKVGIVTKDQNGYFTVLAQNTFYQCKPKGKLKRFNIGILVGDYVRIDITEDSQPMIIEILARRGILPRPRVANVSQALVVASVLEPDLNSILLDKILLMCAINNLEAIICLTKSDLNPGYTQLIAKRYRKANYEVVVSGYDDTDAKVRLPILLQNKITVVCGPSGVGKSSLLNELAGKTIFVTQDISKKIRRGKNTTRHAELIEILSSTFVIDTPGFGSLTSLPHNALDIVKGFPEFYPYATKCRFDNCLHDAEPGCGVKAAVKSELIALSRYWSYSYLLNEWKNKQKENYK